MGEDPLSDRRGAGDLAGGAEEVDLSGGHLPVARHPLPAAGGVAQVRRHQQHVQKGSKYLGTFSDCLQPFELSNVIRVRVQKCAFSAH